MGICRLSLALLSLVPVACAAPERASGSRVQHAHDVVALAGTTRLVGDLVLERATLVSLSGLGLEAVTGDVVIRANATLRSLDGLERLRAIGGRLVVEHNPKLTSLFELASLHEVGGDVMIDQNAALSPCEVAALHAQIGRDGVAAPTDACAGDTVVDAR